MINRRIFVLGGILVAAACGDAAGPDGDSLTQAEALSLVSGIVVTSEAATSSSSEPVPPGVRAAGSDEFTYEWQSSHPCPQGGRVAFDFTVHGIFDQEAGSANLDLTGEQVHNSCVFAHEDVLITVTGAPGLDFTASAATENHAPSEPFTFTVDGALDWSTDDGRSDTCEIHIEAITDFEAKRRTVEATVCEHEMSETFTWS